MIPCKFVAQSPSVSGFQFHMGDFTDDKQLPECLGRSRRLDIPSTAKANPDDVETLLSPDDNAAEPSLHNAQFLMTQSSSTFGIGSNSDMATQCGDAGR